MRTAPLVFRGEDSIISLPLAAVPDSGTVLLAALWYSNDRQDYLRHYLLMDPRILCVTT